MGVFSRPDSPWWWLWLETTKAREKTDIRIGRTASQKRDSRQLAEARYHQRMNELAARVYKLPSATTAGRFSAYADIYERDVVATHRGAGRERRILAHLRRFFGSDLLTAIDRERADAYRRTRTAAGIAPRTINREVAVLRKMLKDAVPKYLHADPLAGLAALVAPPLVRPVLSPADERRILAACDDGQDRALLILGLDTLIRLGDLLDLQRTDRRGPWITVRHPKHGDAYEAVLSDRAAAALKHIGHDDPYYFPKFRRSSNPDWWALRVAGRFKAICERAKVRYGRKTGGFTFHWGTRRTGATRLLIDQRHAISTVKAQGGWKKADVLIDIYAQAEKKQLLQALGPKAGRRKTA